MLDCSFLPQFLDAENPHRANYVIGERCSAIDGMGSVKAGTIVANGGIIRLANMLYDVEDGWGGDYPGTVREFFHEQNITASVRGSLGISIAAHVAE